MNVNRRSLYFTAPHRVEVREERVPLPGPGQVLVRSILSGLSAGTELLVYRGQAPADMQADATISALANETLAFPLKYGYTVVGEVEAVGSEAPESLTGSRVFVFHPHESRFLCASGDLVLLPPDMAPEDALFLASMETAVTLFMDGRPMIGEQVVVFGQGVVGLLTTALLARVPLTTLVTLDKRRKRLDLSRTLGARHCIQAGARNAVEDVRESLSGDDGADLTYELSGDPGALDQAVAVTGFGGRIVVGSWYGTKRVLLNLGGSFHRSRIRMISSQVSSIAPELTGRWDKKRRLAVALAAIAEIRPSRFITNRIPLERADEAFKLLDSGDEEPLQVVFTY